MIRRLVSAALLGLVCASAAEAGERYAVIIAGASGSPQHATQHAEWRSALVTARLSKLPFASSGCSATHGAPARFRSQ